MKIKTRAFEFTKSSYVNLVARDFMRRRLWSSLLYLLVGTYFLMRNIFSLAGIFAITFAVLRPLLYWGYCWRFATSPQNKLIFERRRYEFDDEFLAVIFDDGSNSKIRYDLIVKITKTKEYFLLKISSVDFFHIPFDCFESEEDLAGFQNLLKDKLQIPLPF